MRVLLTGGAGYIGSHTAIALLNAGHEVVIVDNFRNSKPSVIPRIEQISGKSVVFVEADLADELLVSELCRKENIEAAVHFAGLKAVHESVADPLLYYTLNLGTSISLCNALRRNGINKLVFSSSCTVYGEPESIPIKENQRADQAANPYGRTKIMIEQMLEDLCRYHPDFNVARLRYFNPAGAHPSGLLGEDPRGVPNNLVPFITQVAVGQREELVINGDDYDTTDGTCIRDYIHVQDLAAGHVAALRRLEEEPGLVTYNLGTGKGSSVKEVVNAFVQATGIAINERLGPRRQGDVPETWCDPSLAEQDLGWQAALTIEDICRDAWRWQQQNPEGYP